MRGGGAPRATPLDLPLRLPGQWKLVVSFAAIIWMSPGAHSWFTSVTQCIPRKPLGGFCVTYQGTAVRGSEDIFVPAHLQLPRTGYRNDLYFLKH